VGVSPKTLPCRRRNSGRAQGRLLHRAERWSTKFAPTVGAPPSTKQVGPPPKNPSVASGDRSVARRKGFGLGRGKNLFPRKRPDPFRRNTAPATQNEEPCGNKTKKPPAKSRQNLKTFLPEKFGGGGGELHLRKFRRAAGERHGGSMAPSPFSKPSPGPC